MLPNTHHCGMRQCTTSDPSTRTSQEQNEEDCQCAIDQQRLLLSSHAVSAQAILLVLSKASNNLHNVRIVARSSGGQQ